MIFNQTYTMANILLTIVHYNNRCKIFPNIMLADDLMACGRELALEKEKQKHIHKGEPDLHGI